MPSQLVCRPEQSFPVALLRVSGTLDPLTGDALQQAVRHSVALQPTRLLVDIEHLRIGDPIGLSAFSSVMCQTAEWPNVPIVLCGAQPRTAELIAAAPECASIEYAPDCTAAMADADADPGSDQLRVRLRPVPDACRQVRQLVTQACVKWHRADLTATAALIATELVANVVRHAHTTMIFTVGLRDGRLSMAVRDGSRRLPKPADPTVSSPGGRGLRLIRELTEGWGVLPVTDGKVVWTHFTAGTA
ncbi:MAG: ATP-binding protein [Actinoplanes sp.]